MPIVVPFPCRLTTGLAELRKMMRDRRLADPKKFAHVRRELALDPLPAAEAPHQ
jgi:hypothetical protein